MDFYPLFLHLESNIPIVYLTGVFLILVLIQNIIHQTFPQWQLNQKELDSTVHLECLLALL